MQERNSRVQKHKETKGNWNIKNNFFQEVGKLKLGNEIKMKDQSHSYKNKIFLTLGTKHFVIFPFNEDTTKLARNLSALVNSVLEQEAF
jgi:hypothetical protein